MKRMETTTLSIICAWCMQAQGEEAQEGDSHGICPPHAEQELMNYYQGKFDAVPSYAERFALGTEEWENTHV